MSDGEQAGRIRRAESAVEPEPALESVTELLDETRAIAARYFFARGGEQGTRDKGAEGRGSSGSRAFDPVTEADTRIEAVLRAGIEERWPDDRIIGEEEGASGAEDAARCWYLDPIDGTKAFVTGMAGWGTLIGVVEDGRAVAGWMDQPVLGETYRSVDGTAEVLRRGALVDAGAPEREELRVSGCTELSDAVLYSTHPSMFDGSGLEYAALAGAVRLGRYGGDCYAYCQLAAGRVDLVVEATLGPHDIVALIPIVEGAGGVIEGPGGQSPIAGGTVVAAASPELAAQAWEALGR
ncbi:inositol monophosphatase family protein [Dietzia sp.]|uniref:inositol monophosphatase family protein n=1 Tax=Dietzia sp. TaxID=1871616 RepID=UPI002FD8D75F